MIDDAFELGARFLKYILFFGVFVVQACEDISRSSRLESMGYCAETSKYLTDEELHQEVVSDLLALLKVGEIEIPEPFKSNLNFSSAEDFFSKNPFCCDTIIYPEKRRRIGGVDTNSRVAMRGHYGQLVYYIGLHFNIENKDFETVLRVNTCGKLASTNLTFNQVNYTSIDRREHGFTDRSIPTNSISVEVK